MTFVLDLALALEQIPGAVTLNNVLEQDFRVP